MAKINIFGDFKANDVKHLNLSAELVYLLNTSDVNMVNLEAPIRSNGKPMKKSGPNICQDQDSPEWLELRGFNAISMANNHTMDYGDEGLSATISAFKKAKVMGAGSWNEAYQMNSFTSDTSYYTNSKIRDIEASVNTFFNSVAPFKSLTKLPWKTTSWFPSEIIEVTRSFELTSIPTNSFIGMASFH